MLKEAAERDAREAADKSPPVELHDHNECLETITVLNQKMLQKEKEFAESKDELEKGVLKLTAANTSLLDSNKALQEENEELKSSLSSWERKYKEFQRARDAEDRALKDKIHASDLHILKLEQDASNSLDALALQEELEMVLSQRGQLQATNSSQEMEIRRLRERIEQLEEESSGVNPLLLPSAQQAPVADSAFFLTGATAQPASSAQPQGQGQGQGQAGPGGPGGFAEFVQLKKENKSLRAQLQQLRKGAPILSGSAKGVAPGSFLSGGI
jgi:chromosome segregation ATPase